MQATNDYTTAAPTGPRVSITPWASRHLRLCANIRFAAGAVLVTVATVMFCVGYGQFAALPLIFAVVNIAWGYRQLTVARSAVPRS